jgi:2-(1,2-epoxy-1,2-dihydrophenyl)acetyl-CoA isomerase
MTGHATTQATAGTAARPARYTELVAQAREQSRGLVRVDREGAHAVVTLDDPERLNPLGGALTVALREALEELAADEQVRAIVLTGADPAFSAGGDLRLMRDTAHPMVDGDGGAPEIWRWIRMQYGGIARLITRTDKAFVAAVNGAAAGVGFAFVLACDLVLCSERARLVPAFGRIGLLPEVGTSWQLTRRLGYQRTFELFAGGRHLSGTEAAELGLANAVVPHEELLGEALEWCRRIEKLPPHLVTMGKPLLRGAADLTWEQAITMEEYAEPLCFTTGAHREAVAGLLRREPSASDGPRREG